MCHSPLDPTVRRVGGIDALLCCCSGVCCCCKRQFVFCCLFQALQFSAASTWNVCVCVNTGASRRLLVLPLHSKGRSETAWVRVDVHTVSHSLCSVLLHLHACLTLLSDCVAGTSVASQGQLGQTSGLRHCGCRKVCCQLGPPHSTRGVCVARLQHKWHLWWVGPC